MEGDWQTDLDESQWHAAANVKLNVPGGAVLLRQNRAVGKIALSNGQPHSILNLNRYILDVVGGEVWVLGRNEVGGSITSRVANGSITSRLGRLSFRFDSQRNGHITLQSLIIDSPYIAVSVDIENRNRQTARKRVWMSAPEGNTNSGEYNVMGNVALDLGAGTYIRASYINRGLNITDGAQVRMLASGTLKSSTRVFLGRSDWAPSTLAFAEHLYGYLQQHLGSLVVEEGVLSFNLDGANHGVRLLILNDLEVLEGGLLTISEWGDGRDHLLVRKDSVHLKESLRRIVFNDGSSRRGADFREYGSDYWEVFAALPEPSTYAAAFAGVALAVGLVCGRRRQRFLARRG